MYRRLIILIAAILILTIVVMFLIWQEGVPWFSMLKDRAVHGMGISTSTHAVTSDPPAVLTMTVTPSKVISATPSTVTPANLSPSCFAFEQLPPFAFSPDGAMILVRDSAGVQMFDLETGALKASIQSSQNLTAAALSPDGKILAWALQDGAIQLVDLSTQEVLANLIGHPDPVYDLQFSPLGDKLYSASHDGLVRIWDLHGNQLPAIETGREVLGFGVSPDGSKLATIPYDGPVSLWELPGNTKIMDLGGTGGYDTSNAYFSPDGLYLAADLATGIFLWRLADAYLVWHQVVNSMAVSFSPDGQYLAYSDIDDSNKVVLAAPETGRFIRLLDQMQSPVWELFYSPDASKLAITDGVEIRVWRVSDETLLAVGKTACP